MRRLSIFIASLILIAGCSRNNSVKPAYVPPGPSDLGAVLPPPPTRDSQEQAAEYDLILHLQETRSPADVKRVKAEIKYDVFAFADVLGRHFNATECPKTAELFTKISGEIKPATTASKEQWQRPRPTVDPRVHALDSDKSFSYPSGHSTRATVFAELLVHAIPSHREALMERGRQIGWDRVIAGIHFPSDVYGGRVLGHAIAQSMLRDPALRAELAAAGGEIDRVCGIETTTKPVMVH